MEIPQTGTELQQLIKEKKLRIKDLSPAQRKLYNAAAKRKEREAAKIEKRAEKIKKIADDEENESNERGGEKHNRNRFQIVCFGEIQPGVDCETYEQELEVAREFAKALKIRDCIVGVETLRSFCKRIFEAWITHPLCHTLKRETYAPGLERKTGNLSHDYGSSIIGSFDDIWIAPDGCSGDEDAVIGCRS